MTPEFRPAKVVDHSVDEGFSRRWSVFIGDHRLLGCTTQDGAIYHAEKVNAALASAVRERFKFVEDSLDMIRLHSERPNEFNGPAMSKIKKLAESALERLRGEVGA